MCILILLVQISEGVISIPDMEYPFYLLNEVNRMSITSNKSVNRGEIYTYDFGVTEGSVQSGRRPVLVLQADSFNEKAPTVIVAAITTVIKKRYLLSHVILGENFGLSRPSMVLLEQIQTVNKSSLTDYIGYIDDEKVWQRINIVLKKTFGLWFHSIERTGDIRCLCPLCLKDYKNTSNYIVRRLDPLASKRVKCDKCSNMGWNYIIYDKRTNCIQRRG